MTAHRRELAFPPPRPAATERRAAPGAFELEEPTLSSPMIPRPLGFAALGLVLLSFVFAVLGRQGARTSNNARPTAALAVRFTVLPDSTVLIRRAEPDSLLAVVPPGTVGGDELLRQVVRTIQYDRQSRGMPDTGTCLLARWADGRLTLDDQAAGTHIALDAFGPSNAERLRSLLPRGP